MTYACVRSAIFHFGPVDRAELEVVEVVVERVQGGLPAFGRRPQLAHQLLDLRLPGPCAFDEDRRAALVEVREGRVFLAEAELLAHPEVRRIRRRRRERPQRDPEPLPPLELGADPWIRPRHPHGEGAGAERLEREPILQRVHRRQVVLAIDLDTTDDRDVHPGELVGRRRETWERSRPGYWRAMAMRSRSSGEIRWSASPASSPRSICTQSIVPVNRLESAA